MLKGIDPLLTGELLKVLDEMGHSDQIVIADANFPAHRVHDVVIEVPGVDIEQMIRAVVSVMPLDEAQPPVLMESDLNPRPAVQDDIVRATGADEHVMVERWAYYDLAEKSVAIVSTGELRLWANVVLSKGLPYSKNS